MHKFSAWMGCMVLRTWAEVKLIKRVTDVISKNSGGTRGLETRSSTCVTFAVARNIWHLRKEMWWFQIIRSTKGIGSQEIIIARPCAIAYLAAAAVIERWEWETPRSQIIIIAAAAGGAATAWWDDEKLSPRYRWWWERRELYIYYLYILLVMSGFYLFVTSITRHVYLKNNFATVDSPIASGNKTRQRWWQPRCTTLRE